ncbi:MAG TPA: MerR family DNA-binding protein [Streptosporangiaceae bacterium]
MSAWEGAVPPAGRTCGGHRVYDAESFARLELVATLRELGLGLEEVRRVLAREDTVADVAAAHVAALDAQIRSLRLTRAVLSAVARRDPRTEEMTLMNKLARLSAAERRQVIEDFIAEVFAGLDADPRLREKLRVTRPGAAGRAGPGTGGRLGGAGGTGAGPRLPAADAAAADGDAVVVGEPVEGLDGAAELGGDVVQGPAPGVVFPAEPGRV